uniref:Uncharacterized protein n=1 Tax=Grammatophora oceanica TaxID=210454 RepID=A0A7S1Y827_9STRA
MVDHGLDASNFGTGRQSLFVRSWMGGIGRLGNRVADTVLLVRRKCSTRMEESPRPFKEPSKEMLNFFFSLTQDEARIFCAGTAIRTGNSLTAEASTPGKNLAKSVQ